MPDVLKPGQDLHVQVIYLQIDSRTCYAYEWSRSA